MRSIPQGKSELRFASTQPSASSKPYGVGRMLAALICLGFIGAKAARAVDALALDADIVQPAQNLFQLTAEQFDNWVFNGQVHGKQWESLLKSQLNLRIEAINQVCPLNDAQQQKLTLAGRYDIKQFADEYETLKQDLEGSTFAQDRVGEAYQLIQPMQAAWNAGIFGDQSMFNKILPQVLGREQTAKYEQEELKRRKFRYMTKVKLTLTSLEDSMPFTSKQRQQFVELILAETRPPKRWGEYDSQVVMVQASKLPKAKLQDIFDGEQLKQLQAQFSIAKQYEAILVQQGWIEVKAIPQTR
ncbi:MAG: hypothetical protein IT427_03705 [Pirellulales bacterium]|nr:hypothetical protein [Pirellulales bacterium]